LLDEAMGKKESEENVARASFRARVRYNPSTEERETSSNFRFSACKLFGVTF